MPDSAGDLPLFVVIVTGMFIVAAPTVLQLVWLAGVALGGLLWRQHVNRATADHRE